MSHNLYAIGPGKDFIIFNDGDLSMEPVEDQDLVPIRTCHANPLAAAAWSSNVEWYFVLLPEGIALLNVSTDAGFFCKKRSARFIEMFLDYTPKGRSKPKVPPAGSSAGGANASDKQGGGVG